MYSVCDDLTVGFPHSEIHGSKPAHGSPWLIAACHVLHRLSTPRHPPNALKTLDRSHYHHAPTAVQQRNMFICGLFCDQLIARLQKQNGDLKDQFLNSSSIYPTNTGGCMRYTLQPNRSRTNEIVIRSDLVYHA